MTVILPDAATLSVAASKGLVSATILATTLFVPLAPAPTSISLSPALDGRTSWTSTTSAHVPRRIGMTSPSVTRHRLSPADQVQDLHRMSELTWTQLGSMFGVSRRAVHHWATGGRMNAANAELLAELSACVAALGQVYPQARRDALLTKPDATTPSIIEEFRQRIAARESLSGTPVRPADLLDAQHDDRAISG